MTAPRTARTDTELVALARDENERRGVEQLARETSSQAYRLDSAKRFLTGTLGVSADAFAVSHAEDGSVRLQLGGLLLRVVQERSSYSIIEHDRLNLSGGTCPVCGVEVWSGGLSNLADLGGALVSVEAARLVGGRPRTGFFRHAECKCDQQPQPPDPRDEAINKLASALADVLALGGYELGGPQ